MPTRDERESALEFFKGQLTRCRASISVRPDMIEAMERYIGLGEAQGSFLTAVLEDKFLEAFSCADEDNIAAMRGWAQLMYSCVPGICRGSKERVDAWLETTQPGTADSETVDTSTPETLA